MNQSKFTITGKVIDRQTRQGIPGLRIEAWDSDLFFDDFLGEAQETDARGRFRIEFDEERFREFFERKPDLYFKVYQQGRLVHSTEDSIIWNMPQGEREVTIEMDNTTVEEPNEFVVKGTVKDETGVPQSGLRVRAVDVDLRREEVLGEAITDSNGCYEITYTPQQFARAEKKTADLLVRVFGGEENELVASSIHYNAPDITSVDLTIQSGLSEFERLYTEIDPLLKIDDVALTDLTEEDITFLSGETGFDKAWLQILADAARVSNEAALNLDISGNDVIALFYGLGRKGQPMVLEELLKQDLFLLRRMLENAIDEKMIPSYLDSSLDAFIDELDLLASEAGIEKPVSHIAAQQQNMHRIGGIIGLDTTKINTLIAKAVTFNGINDTTLASLIEKGELDEAEARAVGRTVSFYHLLDANIDLTEAIIAGSFQGTTPDLKELVTFDTSDWLDMLPLTGITYPNDLSAEEYAELLTRKIEKLYPSDTLLARLIRVENVTEQVRKSPQAMKPLANLYKGLNLSGIIENQELGNEEKEAQIKERVGLLARFQTQNPDKEFLVVDYSAESDDLQELDFEGFSAEEQQMVLQCFKAYQRIYAVTDDVSSSLALMEAGYDSALKITNDSEEDFRTRGGLSADISHDIYTASLKTAGTTATLVGSIIDVVRGGYGWIDLSNQCEEVGDYLKKIEGFEELFGSQDYCKCQHCQSILSPAAYFVDLMSFVERRILKTNFPEDLQDHVLNLKTRRRDLWELQLTCENTHGLTPYLEIINEVLENYIYVSSQGNTGEELPARPEIEEYVYKEKIGNANPAHSFQQPKLLPLYTLETYLSHFDLTRGEIAKLLEKDIDIVTAAVLNISRSEYQLIQTENTTLTFLRDLYGLDFSVNGDTGIIDKFDAQKLLSPTGLSRTELGELIKTGYIRSSSGDLIQIRGEKSNSDDSVQEDIENIYGLTRLSLDRMHRFVRLWRQLPWSISELDLLLSRGSGENHELTALLPLLPSLLSLQKRFTISVEELCTLWSLIPRQTITGQEEPLFDRLFNLPEFVHSNGRYPKSATFTHPAFDGGGTEQSSDLHRLLAGLRVDDEQLYQLIVNLSEPLGLNLDHDEGDYKPDFVLSWEHLSLLYRHARLAQFLGLSIPRLFQFIKLIPLNQPGYVSKLNDLNTLLEYYDWWKTTDYSIEDIDHILNGWNDDSEANALAAQVLQEIDQDGALTFADTVFAYLDNVTEEQSKIIIKTNSGWITRTPSNERYWLSSSFDAQAMAHTPRLGLTFSLSLFSYIEGVSIEQSKAIIEAEENFSLIETVDVPVPSGRKKKAARLTEAFNPESSLFIPTGIEIDEKEAMNLLLAYLNIEENVYELLMAYHPIEVIPLYLSKHLDFSVDKVKSLVRMTGNDLSDSAFITALHTDIAQDGENNGVPPILTTLAENVLPLSVLFACKTFAASALEFIREEKTDIFSISDFSSISIDSIRNISLYEKFVSSLNEKSTLEDFHDILKNPAKIETVALILDAEPSIINALIDLLPSEAPVLNKIDKLRQYVELVKYLGIDGGALNLIVSENYDELAYDDLAQASKAILGSFRAKYDDEEEWNEKIAPYEDKINTFKRDILSDYLVHSPEHAWCTSDKDLYYYFLLDVDLEGCARTSKVVAAISSVQLYVHRVLMNLEQSEDGEIQVVPDNPKDFVQEWEWRKNYRVWEANRKVFLYPENWIEPELRDNKTPLFEDLESELLQQEINEQTVLDAYAGYMRGFEELAHLKIAGSFHEKDDKNETDTLHLFGVTSDEPPIYYYRGIENAHYGERVNGRGIVWHPWRKVDVQIPVSKVSPIVFRGRLYVFWVEITTRPKNEVKDGSSKFVGYQHKMSLKYTSLRLDGSWTTPQKISLYGVKPFDKEGDGVIEDPLRNYTMKVGEDYYYFTKYCKTGHYYKDDPAAYDGYTLTGYRWDQVYPEVYVDDEGIEQLRITGRDWELIAAPVDFYKRSIKQGEDELCITYDPNDVYTYQYLSSKIESTQRKLYYFFISGRLHMNYALASIFIDPFNRINSNYDLASCLDASIGDIFEAATEIGHMQKMSQLSIMNGAIQNIIIDVEGDVLYLARKSMGGYFWLKRLGTTISEEVARHLLTGGVDGLLDIKTQKGLIEKDSHIGNKEGDYIDDSPITNTIDAGHPDFKGAFGTYYREIFFHIPFLIANHLNSQQKFREAQKWYQYIFDPTAGKEENGSVTDDTPMPGGQECKQFDRVWRYIEFRNLDVESLRDKLTDKDTIEAYRKDPFNPHAIARLRLTAYQKTIVMKYIDNLLDWGDQLFSQDTMESINEASLLYVLASDILGERPAELGECSEIPEQFRNYNSISEVLNENSPFLMEMEHYTVVGHLFNYASPARNLQYTLDPVTASHATQNAYASLNMAHSSTYQPLKTTRSAETAKSTETEAVSVKVVPDVGLSRNMDWNQAATQMHPQYHPRGWLEVIKQISPVFCIPENKGLKQYWDRVEDRLYKIHNCMNISGVRRELALFAPEIDPGLLVRAKAAGLSVEDVLNAISGNLPPYRFSYIIEKAKAYAATLQGFGSALLSALEKKDVEELTLLRTVHEQNIMKLTRQVKQWEIDAAEENIAGLERRRNTVQHRRDYYQSLIDEGLIPWENTQQISRHLATSFNVVAQSLAGQGGILHLMPQLGSLFAMKYGGKELGDSMDAWSMFFRDNARIAELVGGSAGLEAGYQRREQGWKFQQEQADHELKELEKQIKAAQIHKELAERSLQIHVKSLDQLNEVYEFYGDKFSSLGLYTWLSTTLQRLYREAYNSAYSMAKLAEQAYRFERSDDSGELLGSGYWDASRAGLLAGERLTLDLQNLERKYIETNYRDLEINQSFSLAQIAPAALLTLRETGSCEFAIGEIFFDLFYPGHYRRKIKAVRLTIPCVTGPYTNVSATLTLTDSSIRIEPTTDDDALKPVPRTRTLSIATSSAQNDAGVFELNFRDERYMPFEGAGAISSWKLELPSTFRPFDYDTISDVIIHISYTAEQDGALREAVEAINGETEGLLAEYLKSISSQRILSLRHDFPSEFHRLLHGTPGNPVTISLIASYFPYFLNGKELQLDGAKLILNTPEGQDLGQFSINIDNSPYTGGNFSVDTDFGGLLTCDVTAAFESIFGDHRIAIEKADALLSNSGIDSEKLKDILLCITYTLSSDSGQVI